MLSPRLESSETSSKHEERPRVRSNLRIWASRGYVTRLTMFGTPEAKRSRASAARFRNTECGTLNRRPRFLPCSERGLLTPWLAIILPHLESRKSVPLECGSRCQDECPPPESLPSRDARRAGGAYTRTWLECLDLALGAHNGGDEFLAAERFHSDEGRNHALASAAITWQPSI